MLAGSDGLAAISEEVKDFLRGQELLLVTKTKARSRVHRAVPMDFISVKRYGANGKAVGEVRFVGLFTAGAYQGSVEQIPLLRTKVAHTLAHASFDRASHDGRVLVHVLDTFPRDELFQIPEVLLFETALGIFELRQRPRIRAFSRADRFGRFVSVLVYVPRELHSTALRERFGRVLGELFNGEVSTHYTNVGDDPLARIHFILRTVPGKAVRPDPAAVDRRLVEAGRRWEDDLADALAEAHGETEGARLAARYGAAFPASYREAFAARESLPDIARMETVRGPNDMALAFYRPANAPPAHARLKVFLPGAPTDLPDLVPMLENMGLKVVDENPYRIQRTPDSADVVWIEDIGVAEPRGQAFDLDRVRELFLDAFSRAWKR